MRVSDRIPQKPLLLEVRSLLNLLFFQMKDNLKFAPKKQNPDGARVLQSFNRSLRRQTLFV